MTPAQFVTFFCGTHRGCAPAPRSPASNGVTSTDQRYPAKIITSASGCSIPPDSGTVAPFTRTPVPPREVPVGLDQEQFADHDVVPVPAGLQAGTGAGELVDGQLNDAFGVGPHTSPGDNRVRS
jgi:hypothetical protein